MHRFACTTKMNIDYEGFFSTSYLSVIPYTRLSECWFTSKIFLKKEKNIESPIKKKPS